MRVRTWVSCRQFWAEHRVENDIHDSEGTVITHCNEATLGATIRVPDYQRMTEDQKTLKAHWV